ncbi:MAG: anti-sigma factor family protein [Desulfomonilia bacterium]
MNCKLCSRLFQEYLEDTLPEEVIQELKIHLEMCERCRVFYRTYSLTVSLSSRVEQPCCPSTEMMERLTTLLCERLSFLHGKNL